MFFLGLTETSCTLQEQAPLRRYFNLVKLEFHCSKPCGHRARTRDRSQLPLYGGVAAVCNLTCRNHSAALPAGIQFSTRLLRTFCKLGHLDILVITVYIPPIVVGPDAEERDGLRSSLMQCAFVSAVEWPGACACNQYEVGPTYRESVRHEAILVCPSLVSKIPDAIQTQAVSAQKSNSIGIRARITFPTYIPRSLRTPRLECNLNATG